MTATVADQELPRELGLYSALAIGVGTMVGAGIFVLPGAATAGAGPAAIAAFVLVTVGWYWVYTRRRIHEDETGVLQERVLG